MVLLDDEGIELRVGREPARQIPRGSEKQMHADREVRGVHQRPPPLANRARDPRADRPSHPVVPHTVGTPASASRTRLVGAEAGVVNSSAASMPSSRAGASAAPAGVLGFIHDERDLVPARRREGRDRPSHASVAHERESHAVHDN